MGENKNPLGCGVILGISKRFAKSEFSEVGTELRNRGSKRANYRTSSNIVPALMFMFCKQFLLNAVITRISTSMSLIMHTFVYHMKMS